jgi:hypothetical protein
MWIESKLITKRFLSCPECKAEMGTVEHLIEFALQHGEPYMAGPWSCDQCGIAYDLQVWKDGRVEVQPSPHRGRKITTAVLLRLRPELLKGPLYLVVEGMRFEPNGVPALGIAPDDKEFEHAKYYYELHTCPVNYFRCTEKIIVGDDKEHDPHGLFELVAMRDMPKDDLKGDDFLNTGGEEVLRSFNVGLAPEEKN